MRTVKLFSGGCRIWQVLLAKADARIWQWASTATHPLCLSVKSNEDSVGVKLLRSGKYKDFVVKGELTIALGPGFPIEYCGIHIGIRNDARLWQENIVRKAKIFKWEYGMGDKAYVGEAEMLTEFKGDGLSSSQVEWNHTLQHYRGRVEHLISEMVQSRKALNTRWRGSFSLLAAIMKITAHMVGLQERMKGPRYDVFGPWPVCPAHIVAQYP